MLCGLTWLPSKGLRSSTKFVHEHDLRNRSHALIWLSKVYGIAAGMNACQVWGTDYLREGCEFKSQL
eukprot:1129575-Pelagomonas_calceolata.AAC.1